jgi:fibronectin type 3 domain-containing protein
MLIGRWKNWPDQSWLFLASVLPQKAAAYAPSPRPVAVENVTVKREGGGNQLSWDKQPQAAHYRIYRLRPGSAPVWLNSPYKSDGPVAGSALEWHDVGGNKDDEYRVHVVDNAGQESSW